MPLYYDIMPYFDKVIHVYGWNWSILWFPLKIWTPKNLRISNIGHPVSKSWIRNSKMGNHKSMCAPFFWGTHQKINDNNNIYLYPAYDKISSEYMNKYVKNSGNLKVGVLHFFEGHTNISMITIITSIYQSIKSIKFHINDITTYEICPLRWVRFTPVEEDVRHKHVDAGGEHEHHKDLLMQGCKKNTQIAEINQYKYLIQSFNKYFFKTITKSKWHHQNSQDSYF